MHLKHDITEPRLVSLDIASGSQRAPVFGYGWEYQARQRFAIDVAESEDDAKKDVPIARCIELEALTVKFCEGDEVVFKNPRQRQLFRNVRERAEEGTRDYQRHEPLTSPDLFRPASFWDSRDQRRFYYR